MAPSAAALLQLLGLLCSFFCILHYILSKKHGAGKWKRPPGPRPLPIIGNLHILGNLPHQSLYHLAKIHGPMMSIKLGSLPTVVVSSPRVAELFLKTHDSVFASRPKLEVTDKISYGRKGIAFTEHGPYWRGVRKLLNLQLLNGSKIESFSPIRKEVLTSFIESLKMDSAAKKVVNVSEKLGEINEEMTLRMVLGNMNCDEFNFREHVKEFTTLAGAFNLADVLPFLGPFDLQGFRSRIKSTREALDKALEKIIDDHQQRKQERSFLDTMLAVLDQETNPNDYMLDRNCVKALVLDMIVAGLETSTATLDWALVELIRHPRVMRKLQQELESVAGNTRTVEETDLPKLPYLDMVVKETLRLHPVTPLLLPRESMEDIVIDGYYITKKTRVLVNVWAIGRDTNVWSDDVEEFIPERFIDSSIDVHGHDFQLIPFGAGRRLCLGKKLGLTVVKLILAQFVHCFDWELPRGMSAKELDMGEKFGLAVPRCTNLSAMPIYRM